MHQPLEELRQLLKDKRLHFAMGLVEQLEISPTRSSLRVLVNMYPNVDGIGPPHKLVCKVGFNIIDDEAGIFMLPQVNDLALVGLVDGDEEQAFVTDFCSSAEERIPLDAMDGSLVVKARKGKPLRLLSNIKVLIQKAIFGGSPNADATEPLVLGNVMKSFSDAWMNAILEAPQIGQCAVGPVFLDPDLAMSLAMIQNQYVDTASTNFLSQFAFTERGS
jgi:hypothetical protein